MLGDFQVWIDDSPVTSFESDKVRALLAYLAVEAGHAHRRETLVGLLWPDCPEGAARHNLSQALFNLRLALGDHTARPPYLRITRDAIRINRESDYSLDLDRFNACYSAWEKDREEVDPSNRFSRLEEMVRLYRGEFLQQFYLEDSAEYEEWILVQRESLHRRVMNVLTTLANEHERQGDFQTALRYATRQIELDPWREEGHCQVMRLLALDGQRSAALAQYENCRKVLAEELGVEPSTQTRDLYEQIRSGQLKPKAEQPDLVSSAPLHNLPIPLTPLIGREQELDDLAQLIADPECRCITLVGSGGIGKTRLALQAAEQHAHEFGQGTAFIPLASVASIEAVIPTIANGIGFAFYGPTDPKIQLLKYLRDKQMLLVVDNVEHLLVEGSRPGSITDLLIEIMQAASQVKLLVTSREAMNLQGEWSFEVQGLAYPELEQTEGLEEFGAVTLFLQRARRVRPKFEMKAEDKSGVVRLCQMVEGLPLAIELAAAWVRILSPAEIAKEIETNLEFLNAQVRDLPERHRSMQAVFDRSWQMLTEEERHALRRMSVFRGGFTREAAEAVAGAGLVLLSALVAKSLLRRTSEGRYSLHELVRQYVADQLAEVPDDEVATRDRHSTYYTDYVARLEGELKGAGQLQALAEMDADIDNIRAGWRWAVQRGDLAAIRKPVRALWYFFEMHAWYQEAEATFGWATGELSSVFVSDGEPDNDTWALREYLRALQGWSYLRLGKLEKSQRLLQSSLASLRLRGISIELADALYYSGVVAWLSGDYELAQKFCLEALATAEQVGNQWDIATTTGNIGLVAQALGEYEEAQKRFETANATFRRIGEQRMVSVGLYFMGTLKRTLGAYDEAQACFRESLALSTLVGERWIYGMALSQLGEIMHLLGDHVEAIRLLNESLILLRELGEYWSTVRALNSLGAATMSMEAYAASRAAYYEALRMAWERQAFPEVLEAMMGMARLSAQQGESVQALVSAFFVLNHRAATEQTKEAARQLRAELESGLSPDEIGAAQQRAGSKDLNELVHKFLTDE